METSLVITFIAILSPAAAQTPEACLKGTDYQLLCFRETQNHTSDDKITTIEGQPIGNLDNIKTCGPRGPSVLDDAWFLKSMFHFNRQRIPERVAHGRGAGAFGYFTPTSTEILKYSKAAVFRDPKTKIFVRMSSDSGPADTVREAKGFAIKLYTSEGIWDLLALSFPTFFVRDPRMFTALTHATHRNPQTHLNDPNMYFDFMSLRNETAHHFIRTYSPIGLPASYRHMNGFGVNTFKLVNETGGYVFCKFNLETNQGIKNMSAEEAVRLSGTVQEYHLKDLYDAIARNEYPSWTLYIQVMTRAQADKFTDNPFDTTKVWPKSDYPYIEVGKVTLNENPPSYFAYVEQSAFCPSNMPPGIEASPDKMLQGRIFSYLDAQFYRLGANFNKLPVNRATNKVLAILERQGAMTSDDDYGGAPNYLPNSYINAKIDQRYKDSRYELGDTTVGRFEFDSSRNFVQATEYYNALSERDKNLTVTAIGKSLKSVTVREVKERMLRYLNAIDATLGARVRQIVA